MAEVLRRQIIKPTRRRFCFHRRGWEPCAVVLYAPYSNFMGSYMIFPYDSKDATHESLPSTRFRVVGTYLLVLQMRKIEINGIAHSSEQNYMVRSANDLHGGRNVPRAAAKAKIDAGSEQPGGHL